LLFIIIPMVSTVIGAILQAILPYLITPFISKIKSQIEKKNIIFTIREEPTYLPEILIKKFNDNNYSIRFGNDKYLEVKEAINSKLLSDNYTKSIDYYLRKFYLYQIIFNSWKEHVLNPYNLFEDVIVKKYITVFHIINKGGTFIKVNNMRVSLGLEPIDNLIYWIKASFPYDNSKKYIVKKVVNGILLEINDNIPAKQSVELIIFSKKPLDINESGTYIEYNDEKSQQLTMPVMHWDSLMKEYCDLKIEVTYFKIILYVITFIVSVSSVSLVYIAWKYRINKDNQG